MVRGDARGGTVCCLVDRFACDKPLAITSYQDAY